MKKLLFIVAAIILLLVGIMFVLIKGNQKQIVPTTQPTGTTFVSTSTDIVTVPNNGVATTSATQPIDVMKIVHNPEAFQDVNNPGYYFLGNTSTSTISGKEPTYVVVFQSETEYFNISLLKEPLKDARLEAENYLRNMLGLSNEQMCALSYSVGASQDVSDMYAGHDLKFSFCSGSVQLP